MLNIKNTTKNPDLIDAKKIIMGVGILAIIFPIVVYLPTWIPSHSCHQEELLHSISAYYHTSSRDLFIGMICALSFCFFAYNGYSKVDMRASKIAAISALGVAFIPTSIFNGESPCLSPDGTMTREIIHVSCAVILLVTMAIFSIWIFTHREPGETIAPRKLFFYRLYGYLILSSLALIGLYVLSPNSIHLTLEKWKPIFILEAICLISFGCSWLLKSGLFDRK